MKITVGDVMSSNVNVRDYLSVHPENGRIYVNGKVMDKVLVDRTAEWDELKGENERLREALEELNSSVDAELATEVRPIGRIAIKTRIKRALKGESE